MCWVWRRGGRGGAGARSCERSVSRRVCARGGRRPPGVDLAHLVYDTRSRLAERGCGDSACVRCLDGAPPYSSSSRQPARRSSSARRPRTTCDAACGRGMDFSSAPRRARPRLPSSRASSEAPGAACRSASREPTARSAASPATSFFVKPNSLGTSAKSRAAGAATTTRRRFRETRPTRAARPRPAVPRRRRRPARRSRSGTAPARPRASAATGAAPRRRSTSSRRRTP